jgi:transketolase
MSTQNPVLLALSRQKLPVLHRSPDTYPPAENLAKGAYILADAKNKPDVILIGSGAEVHLALKAQKRLSEKDIDARVVSMPSWELFEKMPVEYQQNVLPPEITARVAIEAGVSMGWERYAGSSGTVIGINHFGASAPGGVLMEKYGFTAENVVSAAMNQLNK